MEGKRKGWDAADSSDTLYPTGVHEDSSRRSDGLIMVLSSCSCEIQIQSNCRVEVKRTKRTRAGGANLQIRSFIARSRNLGYGHAGTGFNSYLFLLGTGADVERLVGYSFFLFFWREIR